jgi:signal peptidase I
MIMQTIRKNAKFLISITILLLVVISVRLFVLEDVYVSGISMLPAYRSGETVLIRKLLYTPQRGDVVVFDSPSQTRLVKRIIGLPGEEIEILNGIIYIDGAAVDKKYQTTTDKNEMMSKITIPENSVFLMGDNRSFSSDSRNFGPISTKSVIGVVIANFG